MTGVCMPRVHDAAHAVDTRLHQARFRVPETHHPMLPRPGLVERLHEMVQAAGTGAPLTVVAAPAGTGKSTLAASLAQITSPLSIAWCTLQPADNDPEEFAHAVLQAVLGVRSPEGVGRAVGTRRPASDTLDEALLIARTGDPLVLVLDECEHLGIGPLHATLERLIRQTPGVLSLVCTTNQDLQLPTTSSTKTAFLRAADLALTTDEVLDLFKLDGLTISGEVAQTLNEFARGSIGTLRFAAAAYADARDRERIVAAALRRETNAHAVFFEHVCERLTPDQRTVLLSSSVTDILHRDLAGTVSGVDASRLFDDPRVVDLFFQAIPGCPGWFEHRHPSRELLAAQLLAQPGEMTDLFHTRAARWFAVNGYAERALDGALAGKDWELVVSSVRRRWVTSALEELNPAMGTFARLPEAATRRNRDAELVAAAIELERAEYEGARHRLTALHEHDDAPARPDESRAFELLLRLRLARDDGDPEAIGRAAERVLDWSATQPESPSLDAQCLARRALAEALMLEGELEHAAEILEDVSSLAITTGRDLHATQATSMLAVVTALAGRPRRAAALVDELGDPYLSRSDQAYGTRSLARAICEYHADSLPLAQSAASDARRTLRRGAARDLVLTMVRSRIAASVGDAVAAGRLMTRASSCGNTRLLQLVNDTLGLSPLADTGLAGEAVSGRRTVHPYTTARTFLSSAVRAYERDEPDAAWIALEQALALTARNAYRRLFLDSGLQVAPVLRDYIAQARTFNQVAWQILQRLPAERDSSATPIVETLTERELAVLRHLPLMKSNRDIAAEMYFSVNTVKTHLKSIYRKLGVNQRRAAVEEARARSIL